MRKIPLLILCLILWAGYPVCEESVSDKKASLVHSILNFHIVEPDVMRGSQPSEDGFRMLKEGYNVRTILCLRHNKQHNQWEKDVVEKLGMNFINIPMSAAKKQNIEKIEHALSIINNEANQPIFVHCHGGKDRTGLIFAAYRIKYSHWSLEEALTEMLAYGYDQDRFSNLRESLTEWNYWKEAHSNPKKSKSCRTSGFEHSCNIADR